jgi:primosomal protein N'
VSLVDSYPNLHRTEPTGASIIGPVPCFHSKLNGMYRWQIVLQVPIGLLIKSYVQDGWRIEVDQLVCYND